MPRDGIRGRRPEGLRLLRLSATPDDIIGHMQSLADATSPHQPLFFPEVREYVIQQVNH